MAITFWNVMRKMEPFRRNNSFTDSIQTKYECCGWYNAMDYCEVDHIAEIMYATFQSKDIDTYLEKRYNSSIFFESLVKPD